MLLAVEVATQGELLARREGVRRGELVGHVEGHRHGVVGEPLDGGDPQRVEAGAVRPVTRSAVTSPQISLTCSKGSPQSRQR